MLFRSPVFENPADADNEDSRGDLLDHLGFALLSRQIGVAGLVPPWAAVWLPIVLVILISLTVLLHQEDG